MAKGEKSHATTVPNTALHEGTSTRSDGEVVKRSVPADYTEQGGPTEAPTTTKRANP